MKLKLLFALLVFQFGFAQHRSCGREKPGEIMSDPVKKQAYLEIQHKIQFQLQKMAANKNANGELEVVRIPVAIHFPKESASTSEATKSCLRDLAQRQINVLNADYNAANGDISNWVDDAANYPMVTAVGNLKMQFELATHNHPAGSGIAEGTAAVTFGTAFLNPKYPNANWAGRDTNWQGYLNIVVMEVPNENLGYTPRIGVEPSVGAACFITTFAFGTGTGCTGYKPSQYYNLGRAVTHEVGHYFRLDHPFTNEEDVCPVGDCASTGDQVCDTPAINESSFGCDPAAPGCKNGEYALSMNFMDYADDKCMYMFTKGQETRARAWYNSISSEFKTAALASDTFLQNKFSVYPNPSKGSFTITLKDYTSSYAVEVFDVTGNVVYENNFNQSSGLAQVVNLTNVTTGVYFVNIKSDRGVVTKKLVVQ